MILTKEYLSRFLTDFLKKDKGLYIDNLDIEKINEDAFDDFTFLKRLDISDNQIEKIEGLDKLINLKFLKISYNPISKIEGLDNLVSLENLVIEKKIGRAHV